MFEIPSRTDIKEVVITSESIESEGAVLLVLKPEDQEKQA
jgi:ATP-dependent protease Clp ATPase subunit